MKTCERKFQNFIYLRIFYFVMLIYSSFIIIKIFNLIVFNDYPEKNFWSHCWNLESKNKIKKSLEN